MIEPLTEERRQELIARLASEASDTKLSNEFGVSRKSIWRLRQSLRTKSMPNAIPPSAPSSADSAVMPVVKIPPPPRVPSDPPIALVAPRTPAKHANPSTAETKGPPKADKLDAEPVLMGTYFAVQILRGETHKQVAGAVLNAADQAGVLFRKLQVLDITLVGTNQFVRFRSDLPQAYLVLRSLTSRAIIVEMAGVYVVHFNDGRSGKIPTSTMCSAWKVGFGQVYVGTRIKRWRQQFAA